MMNKFVVRNNKSFVYYVRSNWRYFLSEKRDGVKIVIRKNDVFIHINQAYSVILNDLAFIRTHELLFPRFEASKKALAWLSTYRA